jgi:hypothetical protein
MKGSDFVSTYRGKPYTTWEAAAVDLAAKGSIVAWPMLPVTFTDGVHTLVLPVACDYLAVGTPDEYLRLPMTPRPAQRIADMFGFLMPTKKIATELWRQAPVKATPIPQVPNKGADLDQYASEDKATETALPARRPGIVAGHRKDIVIGKLVRPDRPGPVIWGWWWPDDPVIHGPYLTKNLRASQPIQPYSDAHTPQDFVDYSHGVRFVSGTCTVDGQTRRTADVLQDPQIAGLISDEGPLLPSQIRYNTGTAPARAPDVPYAVIPAPRTDAADRGLDVVRSRAIDRREGT